MTIRKEAVRHIIGRCGFALLAAVLVLFGWKVALSAIQSRILPPDAERLLNDWIDQTADVDRGGAAGISEAASGKCG